MNYIGYDILKVKRRWKIFIAGIMGIPVAGATLPVIACCLIAIYGRNPMLFVSTIILGVGHIGIHLNHRKEL